MTGPRSAIAESATSVSEPPARSGDTVSSMPRAPGDRAEAHVIGGERRHDPSGQGIDDQLHVGEPVDREPRASGETRDHTVEHRRAQRRRRDRDLERVGVDDARAVVRGVRRQSAQLRLGRDVEAHRDLQARPGVRPQLAARCQRLDHGQADAATRVAVVDGPRADADAVVAHHDLELAPGDRDVDLHRAVAAAVRVHDNVVGRLAHGGLDVLDGPAEIEAVAEAGKHVADQHDVLRSADQRHSHVR